MMPITSERTSPAMLIGDKKDEKSVLLNQILTMQTQQAALASRVESLSQASDAAEARERDAEVRLDGLLSQHARQISQRQVGPTEGWDVKNVLFWVD
jgi:hypothetical protein